MNKNIKESLNSLIKIIQETEEYSNFKKVEKLWNEAKDAQKLLTEFLEARQTLQIFQQGNFPGLDEQKTKVKKLYEEVSKHKMIQDWMDAQDKYQQFIWEQADYLTEELGFSFSPKPRGGCCG
jgi:cell fate (sporulation/competence/biofilm development) regulator YlbF (YheA/YmcA/DUF963 family)